MPKLICEISASIWFYYKEVCLILIRNITVIFLIVYFLLGISPASNLRPGKYPKENTQYSNHGESLKSSYIPFKLGLVLTKLLYICLISFFRCGVKEISALLGIYAEWNGSFLPTFRDKVSVP